ncbi:MAG TPA: hypothetical protein IAB59_03705 [Candidatus Onthousia faecipullorum]|uniref:Uncharacterized protein n=1 Tax=Candidatus Onthousia faecipullorum TaxID=2840887 RepID=A0A9D1GB47_9FIRM|nr:hypothetical protein [Candidatus Onthousia faecipullorum]
MNLMEKIKEFLDSEELVKLFEIKGYKPTVEDGWFKLKNIKNNKIERMRVYNDPNNEKRIRFKGENWAFSLNRNSEGQLYLDHLLIGNVEKEEFNFSMRHIIDKHNKNKIIVKLVDDKNVKHTYKIKEESINIERKSIKDKTLICKNSDYDIKEYAKQEDEYEFEYFTFYKDENNYVRLCNQSKEHANKCLKEFLILEKTYISITAYIEKRIPFLHDSLTYINEIRRNTTTPYKMKKLMRETKKRTTKSI